MIRNSLPSLPAGALSAHRDEWFAEAGRRGLKGEGPWRKCSTA